MMQQDPENFINLLQSLHGNKGQDSGMATKGQLDNSSPELAEEQQENSALRDFKNMYGGM